MNYCKIVNGVVVNVATFDAAMPQGWGGSDTWVQNDTAGPGWSYANGVFTAPPAPTPPPPSTNPADYPLTMRQLRQALLTFGAKPVDFVASVISNIADPTQKALATIWYESTVDNIRWDHPETQLLIAASGLPLDQAAALWLKAKDL